MSRKLRSKMCYSNLCGHLPSNFHFDFFNKPRNRIFRKMRFVFANILMKVFKC